MLDSSRQIFERPNASEFHLTFKLLWIYIAGGLMLTTKHLTRSIRRFSGCPQVLIQMQSILFYPS